MNGGKDLIPFPPGGILANMAVVLPLDRGGLLRQSVAMMTRMTALLPLLPLILES